MSRLRRVLRWLIGRPMLVWIGLVLPILLLVVTARFFHSDVAVRSAGLALQLFGFLAAYCGLSGVVNELVDRGPVATIFGWIAVWWGERPFSRRIVALSTTGITTSAVTFGAVKVSSQMSPDATLEMRMDHAERGIEALRDDHGRLKEKLEQGLSDLGRRVDDEGRQRVAGDAGLTKRVQAAFVEGIGWDVLGIWFFVLSSFVGSFSKEIDWVLGAS